MPKSITLLYLSINALLYLLLSFMVIGARLKNKVSLGDGENKSMLQAVRRHGNMAEYLPVFFLLLLLNEATGASAKWLHVMGIAFTVGRVLHAVGLTRGSKPNPERFIGVNATFITIAIAAIRGIIVYIK